MISKVVTYKNGHFYDKETGQRFELAEGSELAITTYDNFKATTRGVGEVPDTLKSQQEIAIELKVAKDSKEIRDYQKIYSEGTILYVWMSINKDVKKPNGTTDKENQKYLFKVILDEDLYVYIKSNWKEGRLWDCACRIIEEPTNRLSFFEVVYGKSLNEVYKNTFVHYFGNNGNPACNAIDRFLVQPDDENLKIRNAMVLS